MSQRLEILDTSLERRVDRSTAKMSDLMVNMFTFGALSVAKKLSLRHIKSSEKRFEDLAGLTHNEEHKDYGICFGYAVKRHSEKEENKRGIYATQSDSVTSNVITPILLNDNILRQHVQIYGTTGSGKTQLLKGVLEQQIARGGGAFAVFGKADNVMLQQMYAVAVEYGREQDFFVVDWTATKDQAKDSINLNGTSVLTNAINIFDLGSVDDVINSLIKISGLDSESTTWSSAAKDYLASILRLLSTLRDADLIFDIDKMDDILESEDALSKMIEHREELSFYTLSEVITDTKKTFKLLAVIEKLYRENRSLLEARLYQINDSDETLYADTTRRDDIHLSLKKTINQQINGIAVDRVIDIILEDVKEGFSSIETTQHTYYKLEVSQGQLGQLITFYNKFGLVLKNKKSDFSFLEAFRSGKIVIFNVPGQESEDAKLIGKMVMSILLLLVKKQGKAPKLEQTYLCIFDEINSWAKGDKENVFGLGDILSVIRGLGMAGIVAHQSSLDSMGKSTSEKEQIQANINTKIVLKTESADIRKELNELVGKKEVKYRKDKIKAKNSRSDDDTDVIEREHFTKEVLGSLWSGQGYLVRNKVVEKMVTYYLPNKRYSVLDEETIPVTKTIDLDTLKKMI